MKTEIWSRNTTEQISSKDKCILHSSDIIYKTEKFVAVTAFKAGSSWFFSGGLS